MTGSQSTQVFWIKHSTWASLHLKFICIFLNLTIAWSQNLLLRIHSSMLRCIFGIRTHWISMLYWSYLLLIVDILLSKVFRVLSIVDRSWLLIGAHSLRWLERVRFVNVLNGFQSGGKNSKVFGLEVWFIAEFKLGLTSSVFIQALDISIYKEVR